MPTIEVFANSIEDLQQKVPNLDLSGGATGRLEIFAPRVAGLCPMPLGSLLQTPTVGQLLAQRLTPAGAILTGHGGLTSGPFQCDGFIEWRVPATFQVQGQARLSLVVALVVVLAAIGAVLAALGWVIAQLRLLVETVGGAVGDLFRNPWFLAISAAVLVLGGLAASRRR